MTKSFHISLPDSLSEFVQAEVARGSFEGTDDYFRALIREKLDQQTTPALEAELLRRQQQYEQEGGVAADDELWMAVAQRRKALAGGRSDADG